MKQKERKKNSKRERLNEESNNHKNHKKEGMRKDKRERINNRATKKKNT